MNIAFLTATEGGSMISTIGSLVLVLGVFWFLIIRPQKKQEKKTAEMRNSIEVGDEIVTIGGIIGIVVSLKEDSLVIETGTDRAKIRTARWAVQQNMTVHEMPEVETKKSKKAKKNEDSSKEDPAVK